MKDNISNIGNLFALSRDVVVGVEDGCIKFLNPPAKELFGEDLIGKPKSAFLPYFLANTGYDRFVSCATIEEQSVTITKSTLDSMELYSIIYPPVLERNAAVRPVSSTVRNLVNNINLTVNLICQSSTKSSDKQFSTHVAMFRHNTARLKRIVGNYDLLNTFLDHATPMNKNVVDLGQLCKDICLETQSLAEEKGISVIYRQSGDGMANVDSSLISQMLLNLISNSLIHSSSGGKVQIEFKSTPQNILLTVGDNGEGIPSHVLANVFRFYSKPINLAASGFTAGLGLCAAYTIANLHNGALIIDSRENIGTKVMVQIPKNIKNQALHAQKIEYDNTIYDSVKTGLASWLTWEDFIYQDE